ncbi:hypothetical protein BCR44DRAFT_1502072 [Catenaria anguillulae PL171]|uniref:Uncharacterized protein n=1 Tax=Catenaria anguillulae PL171 TaxID=765915 RepID=A0A1Y2HER9_9FUNG|nr:hypothetical protein BCR44DRAFT_1502072 [Catenaria anguillulae PL171]
MALDAPARPPASAGANASSSMNAAPVPFMTAADTPAQSQAQALIPSVPIAKLAATPQSHRQGAVASTSSFTFPAPRLGSPHRNLSQRRTSTSLTFSLAAPPPSDPDSSMSSSAKIKRRRQSNASLQTEVASGVADRQTRIQEAQTCRWHLHHGHAGGQTFFIRFSAHKATNQDLCGPRNGQGNTCSGGRCESRGGSRRRRIQLLATQGKRKRGTSEVRPVKSKSKATAGETEEGEVCDDDGDDAWVDDRKCLIGCCRVHIAPRFRPTTSRKHIRCRRFRHTRQSAWPQPKPPLRIASAWNPPQRIASPSNSPLVHRLNVHPHPFQHREAPQYPKPQTNPQLSRVQIRAHATRIPHSISTLSTTPPEWFGGHVALELAHARPLRASMGVEGEPVRLARERAERELGMEMLRVQRQVDLEWEQS